MALIGISMNVLISDVPQGFAHFSSMSLFTSISFLLLAISLLGIYARKYHHTGINAFLHSAIHLMYQLTYPQKFALVSMVMLIPLVFLMMDKLTQLEQNVEDSKLKMIAIEHIQATERLLKGVPEHRGMMNAHLASAEAFSTTLQQKTAEVDSYFSANALVDKKDEAIIPVPDEWASIQQRWVSIKANHQNPITSWRLHTEIIALLAKHLRDVGRVTRLSYDNDPLIHNLVAAQLEILPQLFEKTGKMRGLGAGFIARKSISNHERLMLGSLASDILMLLRESQQLVSYGLKDQKQPELVNLNKRFVSATHGFLAVAEAQLISDKLLSISSEAYFLRATDALAAGYTFGGSSLDLLNRILLQRINNAITMQYTIKLSAVLIILLMLYLFWGFYQSVMNTIKALDYAVQRVRGGEVDKIAALPTRDEMGNVVGSFNVIADELMRVSSRMRAVVDHTVDGIITIDEHGVIKSFNPAAESIFGYSANEVAGQNITMLMPERYLLRHQQGLQRYCKLGRGHVVGSSKLVSVCGLMKNGSEFSMELSISTMMVDDQQLFIGMVRNISERILMEKQLQHAQKMETIGALVGGIAHNFNNLLAGIVGKAYLAKRNAIERPEKTIEHLTGIETISEQAADMVKQLLTFAHKDFFREEQVTPLAILIKEGFKTARLGIPEDISLKLNITAPNIMVRCDANQIQQVLMNMMNNARDAVAACPIKRITITLDAFVPGDAFFHKHAELAGGEYGCLKISDTGHGMDSKTIQMIFDPFYTTKEVGAGTGLGLSSAFGSIAAHSGVIEVESGVGVGTTFSVYLPLVEAIETSSDDCGPQPVLHSLHHEVVLLVDDDLLVIESMCEVLEELGYEVIMARDGQEGLDKFMQRSDEISIIITDVVMPVMGGVEMFREIRKMNKTIHTVFYTGYDDNLVTLNDNEMQNSTVLSKPVQVAELSRIIQCYG
ncbi:MAG: PAS domain S-box protein [Mariprofundus sp.]